MNASDGSRFITELRSECERRLLPLRVEEVLNKETRLHSPIRQFDRQLVQYWDNDFYPGPFTMRQVATALGQVLHVPVASITLTEA